MAIGIGFSTTDYPLSWLIRWATGSKASHTWLVVDEPTKQIYESTIGGFKKVSYDSFAKANKIVKIVYPVQDLTPGLNLARFWVGKEKYDYDELVGGLWVQIGRWLHKKWHNPFHSDGEIDCASSVVRFLQVSSFPGADKLIPQDCTPQDIMDFLDAHASG